jgi:transcriptional regulator with XRE-family HTH domain
MDDAARRSELKTFLRARREALLPESFGLIRGRRRRVPGLRREEVASMADVGVTWYTWLEQGRKISVSREALRRIAHALRLTPVDEEYLFCLSGLDPTPGTPSSRLCPAESHLKAVLNALRGVPAVVFGLCLDVLTFNPLADAIFDFDGVEGPFANNHAWRLFMDPKRRALYRNDWEEAARRCVGFLRVRHAKHFGNARLEALLGNLQTGSREFVRFWNGGCTSGLDTIEVRLHHAYLGPLKVGLVRFLLPMEPDCIVSTLPPADAKTVTVFARLARAHSRQSLCVPAPMVRGPRK